MKNKKMLSFITFALVGLLSCQSTARSNADTKDTSGKKGNDLVQEAEGHEVSFQGVDKQIINTRDLKGKVVFINFWATWCPPCIAEMPSIQTLYNKFKNNKDIVFLLVDVDGDLRGAQNFMRKKKLDLPVFIPNSNLPSSFIEGAIPTTVILDKKGNIDARFEGSRDYAAPQMSKALESLLSE